MVHDFPKHCRTFGASAQAAIRIDSRTRSAKRSVVGTRQAQLVEVTKLKRLDGVTPQAVARIQMEIA